MPQRPSRATIGELYDLVLAAIRTCPERGEVLPHAEQPECGCAELTRCQADRGARPGRVTTAECVACRCAALGIGIGTGPAGDPR